MGIENGICDRCGNECYEEEFGACYDERRCEDCMEWHGCNDCNGCDNEDFYPSEYDEWQKYFNPSDITPPVVPSNSRKG